MAVEHDHVVWGCPGRENQSGDGRVRRSGTVEDDPRFLNVFPGHLQRVDEPGERHAARALGVVVPDRDLALLAQDIQHAETVRLRNILEVHRAETRLAPLHELDDGIGIVLAGLVAAVNAQGHGINPAQVLHQERFALHDAQAPRRGNVAVAEHAS